MNGVRIVSLAEFVAVEEPSSEPLFGVRRENLLPAGGRLLMYGDGGSGKTTLTVDAVAHLAAGIPWLGVEVGRPLRVLVIENEGPRGPFREKLAEKLDGWQGPSFTERVSILADPWAGFSFADLACTVPVSAFIELEQVDLLVAGPLASLGAEGGGTPAEVQAFVGLLDTMKANTDRPYAEWLIHHTNKHGDVSGAWTRMPDTLFHVQGRGNGNAHLRIVKARHSSRWHDTSLTLAWTDGKSFTVEDRPPVTAEAMSDNLLAYVRDNPRTSWTKARRSTRGNAQESAKLRDRLIDEGILVNVSPRDGQYLLFLPDDPDTTRSELGTGLERATEQTTFPLGASDPDRVVPPFPPYRERGTKRNGPGTETKGHQ